MRLDHCLALLASALLGCTADHAAPPVPLKSSAAMPRLERVPFATSVDDPPLSTADGFALGASGAVAMTLAPGGRFLIGIFDTAGTQRSMAGIRGEGPGELRAPMPFVLDAERLLVSDLAQARIVTFDPESGRAIATTPMIEPLPALTAEGDRLLVRVMNPGGTMLPGWYRLGDKKSVALVAATDSFITQHFPAARDPRLTTLAVLGIWRGGVIVADGRSYALALYDSSGHVVRILTRDVAPRLPTTAMIDRFRRRAERYRGPDGKGHDRVRIAVDVDAYRDAPQPHFSHVSPLREDRFGRIWVVGMEGDSAFADLFTPTSHVGHLGIPCPGFSGRWSLQGEWLALLCEAPEGSVRGAELHRYRVVESGGGGSHDDDPDKR